MSYLDNYEDYGFDYKKVAKVMCFLNWQWTRQDRAPTIAEMKAHVEDFKRQLETEEYGTSLSSGGFRVTKLRKEEGEGTTWRVEFILTDWDYE